ncbi:MAG: hypothetical protein IKT41_03915 [Clostridia bacterium]|nr:hypothetical protein [Clostridia bacterium]
MDNAKQQHNTKLFLMYKMCGWDLLFFYAIQFLFFTQIKGITAAGVLFADSFYPIFKFIFQVPCLAIVNKLKIKNSLILGNALVAIGILSYIIGDGISSIILANFLQAIGYNLKGTCETDLLYSSIPKNDERGKNFSKIDGKSSSYYYYFDAITSIISGFLFIVNGYLPIFLCFIMSIISTIISLKFYSPDIDIQAMNNTKKDTPKNKFNNFINSIKFIFGSKRIRSLLIFAALFHGIISVSSTLRSSILVDIDVPEQYFGIIFAVLQIISGIASKNSNWFNKKFKNETLMDFSITFTITFMVVGVVVLTIKNIIAKFIIISLMFIIQYVIKGPYYTLIKRYLSNFSTSILRPKLYTANTFVESIGRAVVYLLSSALLGIASTSYVFVILGAISIIAFIFILSYMKPRVGLKPEEYDKKDIEYIDLK